jgi:hypothetical protein
VAAELAAVAPGIAAVEKHADEFNVVLIDNSVDVEDGKLALGKALDWFLLGGILLDDGKPGAIGRWALFGVGFKPAPAVFIFYLFFHTMKCLIIIN